MTEEKLDALASYINSASLDELTIIDLRLNDIELELDILMCPVCGKYCKEEHAVFARYRDGIKICPQCRIDGN